MDKKDNISFKLIFGQLTKEFKWPFILAIVWLIINIYFGLTDVDKKIITYVNIFTASFFLLSWATGQYNRVKKQLTVEQNFESVESNLIKLTQKLDEKTDHLINVVTGGTSYFYYRVEQRLDRKGWFLLEPVFSGDYPINNLRVVFPNKDSNLTEHLFELKNINSKTPSRAIMNLKVNIDSETGAMTQILFGSDNKFWIQIINFIRKDDILAVISEIYLNGQKVHEETNKLSISNWH